LRSDDVIQWHNAIHDKYKSLIKNKTWSLTKLPLSRHVIGCRWILCIKLKVNGQIDKYKVRLTTKGYSQVQSIHYTEIFSLVVKLSSNRILMTLTTENDYKVHQIDMKIVF
jgi:hypothetical protein